MITIAAIQRSVSCGFGVDVSDMTSKLRSDLVVRPRHVAMWLARQLTFHTMASIGRSFGNRDPSTVHHGISRISGLMLVDPGLCATIATIRAELEGGHV